MMVERGHVYVVATGRLEWCDYGHIEHDGEGLHALIDGEWIRCRKPTEADKVTHEKLTWVPGLVYVAD